MKLYRIFYHNLASSKVKLDLCTQMIYNVYMSKLITTRIDNKIATRIERAVEAAQTDKASFLRRVIIKGLREAEEEEALRLYKQGEISLGKVCDMLGITKWDGIDLLKEYDVPMNYSIEQARRDLE